jgi:hypothetical protein
MTRLLKKRVQGIRDPNEFMHAIGHMSQRGESKQEVRRGRTVVCRLIAKQPPCLWSYIYQKKV